MYLLLPIVYVPSIADSMTILLVLVPLLFMWPQFHWEALLSLMEPVTGREQRTNGSSWMTQMSLAKVF